MSEINKNSLVVGMGTGWEKDTKTKAGPIAEPIAEEALSLAVEQKSPLFFIGGNGGGHEEMPEADRMQNYVSSLVKKALKDGDVDFFVPDIHTDTEHGFERSTSTSSNIQNLIRFIQRRAGGNSIPEEIHVVALDAHMPRVIAITRKALKDAGLDDIVITPHEIDGKELYSTKNGQIRLRSKLGFQVWTKVSHLWSRLNGDAE